MICSDSFVAAIVNMSTVKNSNSNNTYIACVDVLICVVYHNEKKVRKSVLKA